MLRTFIAEFSFSRKNFELNLQIQAMQKISKKALIALSLLGALILSLRSPDFGWRSVWAEDGSVFLQQLHTHEFLDYFSQTYNGYYFTLHRILSYPAHFLSISNYGLYCYLIAMCNYVLCIYITLQSLNGRYKKVFLYSFTYLLVGIPIASGEALQNINNLQWFWYIAWIFFTLHTTTLSAKKMTFFWLCTILLIASAPALLPMLVLARISKTGLLGGSYQKNHANRIFFASGLAIGVLQNLLAYKTRVSGQTGFNAFSASADAFYRIFGTSLLGKILYSDATNILSLFIAFSVFLLFIVFFILLIAIFRQNRTAFNVCLMLFIPTLMGVASSLKIYEGIAFTNSLATSRYFITSSLSICFLILIRLLSVSNGNRKLLLVVFLVSYTFMAIINFGSNAARDNGKYSEAVEIARKKCAATNQMNIQIPISPQGWYLQVPCKKL
jgi:hypothetical protein